MTPSDSPRSIRFGTFEVDLVAGELRKSGVKLKLTGQPFQVPAILLVRPGKWSRGTNCKSGWKDDLFRFRPRRLLQLLGDPFRFRQRKTAWEAVPRDSFEGPELMVSDAIPKVDFSLTQNQFVLTMEQRSGSIWILGKLEP
jgi:hypothetical protein